MRLTHSVPLFVALAHGVTGQVAEVGCASNVDTEHVLQFVQQGRLQEAAEAVEACAEARPGIFDLERIQQAVSNLLRKAHGVSSAVQKAKAGAAEESVVNPAFEWAQSATHVFLGVKFAHKLDAPACIDLVNEEISIQASSVSLRASCKGKNKRFEFAIELLEPLDAQSSTWAMASVGRGTFTLVKATPQVKWERLLQNASDKPRNMHTWWALQEQYRDELAALSKASESLTATDTDKAESGETPEQATAVGGEETLAVENEKNELRKRAKIDSKRVNKDTKKQLKAIDKSAKERLEQLESRCSSERTELDAETKKEKERVTATQKDKIDKIEATLSEALKALETANDASSSPWSKLYDTMHSALFGDDEKEKEEL